MQTGTVKWFNNSKWYGLIIADNGEEIPVFNYRDNCLLEGQKVKFDLDDQNKLPVAINLQIVDKRFNRLKEKSSKYKEQILHDHPRVSVYENVLPDHYCDDLIKRSLDHNYPGKYISMSDHRADCGHDSHGQANDRNIHRRILNDFAYTDYDIIATAYSEALGIPYHLIESSDILYYEKGHYMTPHHDWPYDPTKIDYYKNAGTRQAVALIYLNDNFQGGETYFPKLDVTITPKKGSMSVWHHTQDLNLDWLLIHEGKEILEGEKFAIIFGFSTLPRTESRGK